jgi:cellulose synthase/poly-beta-1,6-N-acetylglucosamine synthase-like glycosyltransferase
MVIVFGWIALGTLVGLALMQSIYVWLHCRFLQSNVTAEFDESFVPKVAIVLCLRGSDPSLVGCLGGLVQQDYPNYEIHVVADDKQDPALETVREFFSSQEHPPTILVLTEHSESRSLKCSAIIGAISELDDSIEVVALIDADAVADRNWLKDLVRPLADNSIGATTGNRWFEPESKNFAAEVRQAWNAAAICQMTFYSIPWGGSLAIKRSTIDQCRLLDHWSSSFCEDTMLTRILKANQLRMVRVPDVVLANEESATMAGTFRWIVRQLLTVRLYHRDWPLVFAHGIFLGFCWVAVPIAMVWLFFNGETKLGGLLLLAFLLFEIGYAGLFAAIRGANLRAIHRTSSTVPRVRSSGAGMPAILVTQLLYPVAVLTAATAKNVSWRGIDYAIGPGNKVKMLGYRPYLGLIKEATDADKVERSIS